jgi:tellurite resistance protein
MNSMAVLKATLAVAQADHRVDGEELQIFEQLIALEDVDGWDRRSLLESVGQRVDLKAALVDLRDEVERKYALALCFVMAIAGGITPPETKVISQVAAGWGFDPQKLAACRREGEVIFQRLQ